MQVSSTHVYELYLRPSGEHLEYVLAFSWYKAGCECTVRFSNQKGGPLWQELPHQAL